MDKEESNKVALVKILNMRPFEIRQLSFIFLSWVRLSFFITQCQVALEEINYIASHDNLAWG